VIPTTDIVLARPAEVRSVAGPVDQSAGPRPNRDPEAVPDGRRPDGNRVTLEASASLVTSYRFRGLPQSDGHAAVQGSVEAASPAGFYVGGWASTASVYAGSDVELDLYGGYRVEMGSLRLDAGVISYFYPGADASTSTEIYASAARDLGDVEVRAGASYAPRQAVLGDTDGLYLFAEAEVPVSTTPFTVRTHLGRERGVNVGAGATKIDWLLGADYAATPVTLSVAWVGARYDRVGQGSMPRGIVGSLSFDF